MKKPPRVALYHGYGDLKASVPLDKYTYVEFEDGDLKLRLSFDRGELKVHADVLGQTLTIKPLVSNQVLVGIDR